LGCEWLIVLTSWTSAQQQHPCQHAPVRIAHLMITIVCPFTHASHTSFYSLLLAPLLLLLLLLLLNRCLVRLTTLVG
jgi:hypothetical protein